MGTSCTIARLAEDGMFERIHVSYDGYLTGVGLKLFRHYGDQDRVDALFSHEDWATSLQPDPEDIDWSEWDGDSRRQTRDAFINEHGFADDPEAQPGNLGLYVHAHGRWAAPSDRAALVRFLDTGEGDVITREMLIADGACDDQFTAPLARPVDEHVGTLRVELVPGDTQNCILHLVTDDGQDYAVAPGPGFQGVEGASDIRDARDLEGLRAVVRSSSIAVSSSFGPQGSSSNAVIGARSIRIVADADTNGIDTATGEAR